MIITQDHCIVCDPDAAAAVRTAAGELQCHLRRIAGLDLDVVEGPAPEGKPSIRIGVQNELAIETYALRTEERHLLIGGGSPRGVLYGVYGLLRDHLGCRWFTPDCDLIPRREGIEMSSLNERKTPAFHYRNFILDGVNDPAWAARNGYNGINSPDDPAHGGHVAHWHYGHSLFALCPAEQYFADHPEYFDSTSRAKSRVDDHINLCFTNDDVVRIVADNMRRAMAEAAAKQAADPRTTQPTVFYLAQHDGGTTCTCPACRKIIDDQGALSAPLIHFCNRVVETLGDEFPDFRMMTIAYRFSRRPPRSLRPDPRLIVQLCSIECCQSHPYATCDDPDNARYRRDLEGWRALTDNLWIWDYMPRLWHPFLTGPGFEAMAANYRWFRDHGIRGMFTQTGGERDFKWLNAWLMCQMMRDPDQDWTALRDEFMDAYYGPAAAPLRAFLAGVQQSVAEGNHHLHYKEGAVKPFFSETVIQAGDRRFAEAAEAVTDDPTRAARVQEEFMHFLGTKLQHGCRDSVMNRCAVRDGRYGFDRPDDMRRDVARFADWKLRRFGAVGPGGYTRRRGDSCTLHVETDLISLDNGTLELEFLPRLAGRMVGLRHKPSGHNFLHVAPCTGGRFNLENGYREEWLAAPAPYEQESSSGWSRTQGASAGAAEAGHAASVGDNPQKTGQVFETGGKYLHPLQWERWTRLAGEGGTFHIESMVVNRGAVTVAAPVETILPLCLGAGHEVTISDHAGTPVPVNQPLLPRLAASGFLLRNRRLGLLLRWRAEGEVIEQVGWQTEPDSDRLTVRIRTRAETLTPGAGRRFCQFLDIAKE